MSSPPTRRRTARQEVGPDGLLTGLFPMACRWRSDAVVVRRSPTERQCPIDDDQTRPEYEKYTIIIMKMNKITTTTAREKSPRGSCTILRSTAIITAIMFAAQQTAFRAAASAAGRGPRVYNALVTSEQRLLPSQAEPILTPTFQAAFPFFYGGWPYAFEPSSFSFPPAVGGVDTEAAAAEAQEDVVAAERDDDAASRRPLPPVVKNNRPAADSLVPDVPPPPLPVAGRNKDKKKPEEYPPAPVGFAI